MKPRSPTALSASVETGSTDTPTGDNGVPIGVVPGSDALVSFVMPVGHHLHLCRDQNFCACNATCALPVNP